MLMDVLIVAIILVYGARVIYRAWKNRKKQKSKCGSCPYSGMCH